MVSMVFMLSMVFTVSVVPVVFMVPIVSVVPTVPGYGYLRKIINKEVQRFRGVLAFEDKVKSSGKMEFELLLKSHTEEEARKLLNERYSLQGSQKPFLVLHAVKQPEKKISKHRQRKSTANAQLAKFLKCGSHIYNDYIALNELWNEYITGVIGNKAGAAQSVLSADWHGADVRVKASKNPTFINTRGILLWESRNQLLIASTKNKLVQVPKHGTIFELHVPCAKENKEDSSKKSKISADDGSNITDINKKENEYKSTDTYIVIGDRVQCRSTERTTRKFKPHDVSDIARFSRVFW